MKEKVQHREREGRARVWVLEKIYYYYYFLKILLMWKIVGASKAFVLYVYIDNNLSNLCKKKDCIWDSLFSHFKFLRYGLYPSHAKLDFCITKLIKSSWLNKINRV